MYKRALWLLFSVLLAMSCSFTYDTFLPNENDPNMVMENAEYVRIKNGNPEIQAQAEEIRQYEAKHTMELDNFSFRQYNIAPEGQENIPDINASGKASQASLETDTGNFNMSGGVSIEVISEDFSMETPEISWQDKDRLLRAPGTVHIRRSNGTTLQGTGFSADARSRNWEFDSAVEGSVVEDDNN